MNVRAIAAGPVATTFTADNLQAAYGGRLAPSQLDDIAAAIDGRRADAS